MPEAMGMTLAWAAGAALGAFFFGGLWWTVRRGLTARQPALWFLGSAVLRMSVTLGGFYLVSDQRWERLLLCLLGFAMARPVVVRLTRPASAAEGQV